MIYEYIIAFILGSCIGSFLNVCIYRLPKDTSIVSPRSSCPSCKAPISWYDNIPLMSFCILKGKCRSCGEKIRLRYPLVELLTAALCLFLYIRFGLSMPFFKFFLFFCLLITVAFIDIDYHAIPGYMCFIGICAGIGFAVYETFRLFREGFFTFDPLIQVLNATIFGLGFTYLFKFFGDIFLGVYLAIIKKDSIEGETESLGLGDVDFMGVVGAFLGAKLVVTTFFIAPFIAIVYSVGALIFKKSHLIPYLPYLSLASLISFLWGVRILSYLGF